MQRTVKIRIENRPELIQTIKTYSEIYKYIANTGLKNNTWNKVELHKLTYKNIRNKYPDFPSAMVQTVRDVASEALKRTKLKTHINCKEYSSIRLDKRNLRVNFQNNMISISSINGRLKFSFKDNKLSQKYKTWSPAAGMLVYKNGNLFLNLVVEKETPQSLDFEKKDVLGIDRGVNNIIVCSNNQFFNSKKLKAVKGRYQYLRKVLQSKGTPSATRKLKLISGREIRFVADTNHQLSKAIAESDFKVFALEKLAKMTNKKNGRRFNRKLGNWSFKQFETFLKYKAEALGKKVVLINPRYTSQKCSKCNKVEKSSRKGSWYSCSCGLQLHADLNASRNIANLGISEISRLSVNQPIVASEPQIETMDSYKPPISIGGN